MEFHFEADSNKTDAQLECRYDLDKDDLYSINWYKDRREFYRFYPHQSPQAKVFRVNGVNVDVSCNEAKIKIKSKQKKISAVDCQVKCYRRLPELH